MTSNLTERIAAHLRLPGGEYDFNLEVYELAAWEYVRAFTGQTWTAESTDVPASVTAAVLLLIADLYENREAQSPVPLAENKAVERLLWPHRSF